MSLKYTITFWFLLLWSISMLFNMAFFFAAFCLSPLQTFWILPYIQQVQFNCGITLWLSNFQRKLESWISKVIIFDLFSSNTNKLNDVECKCVFSSFMTNHDGPMSSFF